MKVCVDIQFYREEFLDSKRESIGHSLIMRSFDKAAYILTKDPEIGFPVFNIDIDSYAGGLKEANLEARRFHNTRRFFINLAFNCVTAITIHEDDYAVVKERVFNTAAKCNQNRLEYRDKHLFIFLAKLEPTSDIKKEDGFLHLNYYFNIPEFMLNFKLLPHASPQEAQSGARG